MTSINNKKRDTNKNVIESHAVDKLNRYCQFCHLGLVMKEPEVFMCPRCNVSTVLKQTEPAVKIRTQFPTYDPSRSSNEVNIIQPQSHRLPRSEYFIRKSQEERNKEEMNDSYLNMLKNRNDIRLTNVEYYDVEDYDYRYNND